MYDWTVLNLAVSAALAGGRVGTPVFVRWTASVAQSEAELKPLLGQMSQYAEQWLASRPRQVYAAGAETDGHLSMALELANGSSALLAIALAHGRPNLDIAVYGSDGALYHSGPSALPGPDAAADSPVSPPASDALGALNSSLATNQPVLLSEKGGER